MDAWEVVVVGGGAAGLLAACRAAQRGRNTLVLEKKRRPGVKILMSGGGHCNVTHATDARGIVAAFGVQGRFLHSALAALAPQDLISLIEQAGVPTRVEPNGKVLPASDKASDILAALMWHVQRSGATVACLEPVTAVERLPTGLFEVSTALRRVLTQRLVLTTGGCSYPGCGTTGDGYGWAAALGHTIVPPRPALAPILTDLAWVTDLKGITVPDVELRIDAVGRGSQRFGPGGKWDQLHGRWRGSLLFAHFGLTGPVALDASRVISGFPRGERPLLLCDFLPELNEPQLDELLSAESGRSGRRVAALLESRLPRRLAEALAVQAGVAPDGRAAELSRKQRLRFVQAVKSQSIATTGTLGLEKAEVTAGGVSLDEVDSRTMASKLVPGLYLAGELLDLDGPIGGYNLQAAFSTGYLAGEHV